MDERIAAKTAVGGGPRSVLQSRRLARRRLLAVGLGALGIAGGRAEAGIAWRQCRKCRGLVRSGQGNGVCPKGGRHAVKGSKTYGVWIGAPGPGYESDWFECGKCRGMYWGESGAGVCPAGGGHLDAGSLRYAIKRNQPSAPGEEAGWRYCSRCNGLFHPHGKKLGKCPAGGAHTILPGNDYVLIVVS